MAGKELGVRGQEIRQWNYFDGVLRNGQEYADASRYVMENPMRWEWDAENPMCKHEPKEEGTIYRAPSGR